MKTMILTRECDKESREASITFGNLFLKCTVKWWVSLNEMTCMYQKNFPPFDWNGTGLNETPCRL